MSDGTVTPSDLVGKEGRKGALEAAASIPGDTVPPTANRSPLTDAKVVARFILGCTMSGGDALEPEPGRGLEDYADDPNLSVRVRGLAVIGQRAGNGSLKDMEFMLKTADEVPTNKTQMDISAPIIINDIPLGQSKDDFVLKDDPTGE